MVEKGCPRCTSEGNLGEAGGRHALPIPLTAAFRSPTYELCPGAFLLLKEHQLVIPSSPHPNYTSLWTSRSHLHILPGQGLQSPTPRLFLHLLLPFQVTLAFTGMIVVSSILTYLLPFSLAAPMAMPLLPQNYSISEIIYSEKLFLIVISYCFSSLTAFIPGNLLPACQLGPYILLDQVLGLLIPHPFSTPTGILQKYATLTSPFLTSTFIDSPRGFLYILPLRTPESVPSLHSHCWALPWLGPGAIVMFLFDLQLRLLFFLHAHSSSSHSSFSSHRLHSLLAK